MSLVTEVTPVCWAIEVTQEALDSKEWPECLASLGQKGAEVHPGWTASKACWGSKDDPGSQGAKERLDFLEFRG